MTMNNESLLAALRWRYAVKKFDPARRIPAETWSTLEHSLVLSPSSFGLQPWKFIVVESKPLREQLVAASWNQTQVKESSHLVVFAARKGLNAADVDAFLQRTAEVRGVPIDTLKGYGDVMRGFVSKPGFDIDAWSARQTYIAIGMFLASCAVLGIDACPMEGIVADDYDRLLGLDTLGLRALAVVAAGYRAADDKYATTPKVRFAPESVILRR